MSGTSYHRLFDPHGRKSLEDLREADERTRDTTGDRRDGKIYYYDEKGKIVLAVNVALATGRPLLVRGPSGGGKSSLAFHAARVLQRRYYEFVVTARTEARDLTWRFDAVRRLADAQVPHRFENVEYLDTVYPYIEPGVLWWIYGRDSALNRGRASLDPADRPKDPAKWDPAKVFDADLNPTHALDDRNVHSVLPEVFAQKGYRLTPDAQITVIQQGGAWNVDDGRQKYAVNLAGRTLTVRDPRKESAGAVLLIDEIDKADPDVPNNLLVELGSLEFDVDLISQRIRFQGDRNDWKQRPLIIVTTNQERPLPIPFLRRCVVLDIEFPQRKLLWKIAEANFPGEEQSFFDQVLEALLRSKPGAGAASDRVAGSGSQPVPVSIAEYVDTVRACVSLRQEGATQGGDFDDLLADIVEKTGSGWKEKDGSR